MNRPLHASCLSVALLSGALLTPALAQSSRSPGQHGHPVQQGQSAGQTQPRDGASLIINPHLGPRTAAGELRDGASLIINPLAGEQYAQGSGQHGRRDPRLPGQTINGLPTAPALPTTPLQPRREFPDRSQELRRADEERRNVQRNQENDTQQSGRPARMGPGGIERRGLMR